MTDSSATGNHGQAFNGATTTANGRLDRGGVFDGVNNYVDIPSHATLSIFQIRIQDFNNFEHTFLDQFLIEAQSIVPEPSSGVLALVGLSGWLGVRRRRRVA